MRFLQVLSCYVWFQAACLGQVSLSDAQQESSKFIRGDFAQVVLQPKYDGPTEVVEPKGEFAEIDVKETNDLLRELTSDDLNVRKAAIIRFKKDADRFTPPAYFVAAADMFKQGELDEAAFWLNLGRVRAISDVMKCSDRSAAQAVAVLNDQFGMGIQGYLDNWQKMNIATEKALKWDQGHERKYDSRWIALHGMDAFTKTKVSFEPQSRWKSIDRQSRNEIRDGWAKVVDLMRKVDADMNGIVTEEERMAFEGPPLEVAPNIREKSMCSDVLFNDVCNMAGGIKFFDQLNFPNARRRKVVDIEVFVSKDKSGNSHVVERWTVERDGQGACDYTVTFTPDGSGGTWFVTSKKCEPRAKK